MKHNRIKKGFRFVRDLVRHFTVDFLAYAKKAWQAQLVRLYLLSFIRQLIHHLNQFRIYLYVNGIQQHHINEEGMCRLSDTARGLHMLLPKGEAYTYSILVAVDDAAPALLKRSLRSALNQSAPFCQVIIGLMRPPSLEIETILAEIRTEKRVEVLSIDGAATETEAINVLAQAANGRYLFILGQEDWMRPDCLLRFEQTLRTLPEPENAVVYCNGNEVTDRGFFVPETEWRQPPCVIFPYFFKFFKEKGVLIPSVLWKKIGGLSSKAKGAEYEALLLELDLQGALFEHLPLALYAIPHGGRGLKTKCLEQFLEQLRHYSVRKGIKWEWTEGYRSDCVRALPAVDATLSIQVIIPYKDQRELTLRCVESVLNQKEVTCQITAIDNASTDASIGKQIEQMGGEVLTIREPFNYSRLNNRAVRETKKGAHCQILVFLNNDVELQSDALFEMLRWICQPKIGMVGCRLHYPDGRLQHGGVVINPQGLEEMRWEHVEKLRPFEEMVRSKELGFFDAVTAACAMVKREHFLAVGGFDEIWHPIGYSDTQLAALLARKGLKSFYTPYAVGTHHESVSRKKSIEDFENSKWLHSLLEKRQKWGMPHY